MKIFPGKHHIYNVRTKVCNSIGILYRNRCILSKFLRKQLYFFYKLFFIAWASKNKSKLQALYCYQEHAARVVNFKDKLTSYIHYLNKLMQFHTVYEMNMFQIRCFMYL